MSSLVLTRIAANCPEDPAIAEYRQRLRLIALAMGKTSTMLVSNPDDLSHYTDSELLTAEKACSRALAHLGLREGTIEQ